MNGNWVALVIITTATIPIKQDWPDDDAEQKQLPSIDVDVKDSEQPVANIGLHMDRSPRVHKMIGVAAETTVHMPTTAIIEFTSQELCLRAAATLRLQPGVLSVSCLQRHATIPGEPA